MLLGIASFVSSFAFPMPLRRLKEQSELLPEEELGR